MISGTLKYVTDGWDAGTWGTGEDTGNYLALKFTVPEGATRTTVQLLNGVHGAVDLDSDMNCIFRVTNASTQKVKIVSYVDNRQIIKTYSLTGLTLENS